MAASRLERRLLDTVAREHQQHIDSGMDNNLAELIRVRRTEQAAEYAEIGDTMIRDFHRVLDRAMLCYLVVLGVVCAVYYAFNS